MKKYLILVAAACAMIISGCSDNNGNDDGGDPGTGETGLVFTENGINYIGNGDKHFPAPTGDYKLDASKKYVLRGWVYIQNGSKITIPAGTIIKGDKETMASLIIEPGAQIIAQGTSTAPIVFTSNQPAGQRKPGDWGGLIICGNGINNKTSQQIEGGPRTTHGGNKEDDNSGILSYVRVEFAGYPFETDKEINGITFGSVGSGTQVDHIQVSYSNDDSFEWFGGSVNCKYLVAYHGWDDDFDTDNGFRGRMQFLLSVRNPKLADTSYSNGFESDNNADASTEEPFTQAAFCNVSLIGPVGQDDNFVNLSGTGNYIDGGTYNPNNGSKLGQFQSGVQIRRNSHITLANSVVSGWPVGLIIENDKGSATQTYASSNNSIENVFFGGFDTEATSYDNTKDAACILGSDVNKNFTDRYSDNAGTSYDDSKPYSFSHSYVVEALRNNTVKETIAELGLGVLSGTNLTVAVAPDGTSILKNNALTVPEGFDTQGNGYAGAFASTSEADNWMAGWTEFDPQNKAY